MFVNTTNLYPPNTLYMFTSHYTYLNVKLVLCAVSYTLRKRFSMLK